MRQAAGNIAHEVFADGCLERYVQRGTRSLNPLSADPPPIDT